MPIDPHDTHKHDAPKVDADHPGYELQDVNVGGVITFLGGLLFFVLIFFVFCFYMGKVINTAMIHQDGDGKKWGANLSQPGVTPHGDKREDLKSNADIEQKQLGQVAQAFPTPRLESDDGNQDLADLHAREDLLLNYTSSSNDLPAGTVRIPIEQAMALVVKRGLPKAPESKTSGTLMAGESALEVQAPLTTGFARTGYELQTIAAREQQLEYTKASEK